MSRITFTSVDAYLDAQPDAARNALERVRRAIRRAVPGGDEVISYGIPTYKWHGRAMLYFAGWKAHYSLYPITRRLALACADDFSAYDVRKSTIRFSLTETVPVKLIERIAKFRAKEMTERQPRRKAAAKRR